MPAQSLKALHVAYGNNAKSQGLQIDDPDITKGNGFSIAPELLMEEEDFNTRGAFLGKEEYFKQPKIKEHIRKLADAYKRADYVPPIIVKVKDDVVYIRDGHCRKRAIMLAKSEGAQIQRVRVEEQPGDEAAQTLLIVTSNDGAPLSVLERAVVFGRLKGYGWDLKKISTHVGVTQENVRHLLKMLELPIEIKKQIQRNEVSATYAMELYTEHGSKAIELIKAEIEAQKEGEKTPGKSEEKKAKVTKKRMSATPRFTKAVVTAMHSSFVTLSAGIEKAQLNENGNFVLEVSPETMELLNKVKDQLTEKQESEADPKQQSLV